MASDKGPPRGSKRGRRPPPVINLEATEVETGASANAPPASAMQASNAGAERPAMESPRNEPSASEPPGKSSSTAEQSPIHRFFAWLPEELSWTQVSAGMAGAAGGLLVFVLLWLMGAFQGGREPSADLGPRLASIEKQLSDLAARPTPASIDPKAIEEIAARLAKLERAQATPRPMPPSGDPKVVEELAARLTSVEHAQAAPRPPVTDPVVLSRLGATERSVKSITDNMAALSRRADGVDAAMRDIKGRLDKLSAALTELQTGVRAAGIGSDRAVRLAVAASALRAAAERGVPFAAELATVKSLMPSGETLAVLEPYAASGLPTNAMLGQELAVIVHAMLRASGGKPAPAGGNFLERLLANAEKLVRVRPIDEIKGEDRGAILARIERRASRADIPGALTELEKLPAADRRPVQEWIAKVRARDKADETCQRIAVESMAALKATP